MRTPVDPEPPLLDRQREEMELAFAGLHLLVAPLLDRLGRLPDPQRNALGRA